MTDKVKKRRRDLAESLGVSHRVAGAIISQRRAQGVPEAALAAGVAAEPPPTPGPLEALLAALRVTRPFGVLVRSSTWSGRASADARVAFAPPDPDAGGPSAESGSMTRAINRNELEMLLAAGAANGETFQMIRSFHDDGRGSSFSVQCEDCRRWIHCGRDEREDACVCGQRYRVVFDLATIYRTVLRISGSGARCMDCGKEWDGSDESGVWRPRNAWQIQCDACFTKTASPISMTVKDGISFLLYPDRDERGDFYEVRGGKTIFGTIRLLATGKSECFMRVPTADRYFTEMVQQFRDQEAANAMHTEQHTLVVGAEVEIRFYVKRAGRIQIASDNAVPGLHVTWLEIGNVSRIEGMPAAETISGFPVPADRMLRVRLRNLGPTTRRVSFSLMAA